MAKKRSSKKSAGKSGKSNSKSKYTIIFSVLVVCVYLYLNYTNSPYLKDFEKIFMSGKTEQADKDDKKRKDDKGDGADSAPVETGKGAKGPQPDIRPGEKFKHTIGSFAGAKRLLRDEVYKTHRISFYCECKFSVNKSGRGPGIVADHNSCGYKSSGYDANRGKRIEWEHVVPAHAFGHFRTCWKDNPCEKAGKKVSNRKCCQKTNLKFRHAEADMHNLQPAIGEVNARRSNYPYGIIPGEERDFGRCDFEYDKDAGPGGSSLVEPKEDIRGDIARTYFYMMYVYGVRLTKDELEMMKKWDKADPVDAEERRRNEVITKLQGNRNPFIK